MGRLVKIQDIDQFSRIVNVPESSITPAVLDGIRNLDERHELEPLIRKLLFDPTDTPHGPTEIADILTTKVRLRGTRCLGAFVIKGRSFEKVRSRDIDHQVIRLRQLPGLGLMGMIASGDIQDDAQRDFLQMAMDAGCDYLIIEVVDLARLLVAYEAVCPSDGTAFGDDGICAHGHEQSPGVELTLHVHDDLEYDVVNLNDVSHAGARRLKAKVVVNPNYDREALREIIRRATSRIASSPYHRSDMVAQRFGKANADVVWLFLAGDLQDVRNYNWLARTQWIDPGLDMAMRPMEIEAVERVDDIGVVWNESYRSMRKFYGEHTADKGDLLALLEPLIEQASIIGEKIARWLSQVDSGDIPPGQLTSCVRGVAPEIDEILEASGNAPFAPQDVRDFDTRAQSLFGWLHNMSLFHTERGVEIYPEDRRVLLTRQALQDFESDLQRLEVERKKLHSD